MGIADMTQRHKVKIGSKLIGDGEPCFITFEAGPTHDSLETAKRLVKLAMEAGADAVKFQIMDVERLMADKDVRFSYGVLAADGSGRVVQKEESLYEILKRRELSREEWRELKAYCDELGIPFFATVCFEDEVDFVHEIGCASIKIASADINHLPLIRHAAQTGLCIQLDTGSSTIGEVERAVDAILAQGNDQIIIHHCPSGYPARLEGINLNVITSLRQMFDFPIAFSDHTPEMDMDIAALALGANLLEKTITEDRAIQSVEHVMSLEPHEMKDFVRRIRDMEIAFGSPRRLMGNEEREKRQIGRRSAHLKRDLPVGHVLSDEDIEYRRPGGGIPPDMHDMIVGARLRSDMKAEERLSWSHLFLADKES